LNNPGYFEVIYLKDVTQFTLSLDATYPLSEYWAASLAFYKHFYGTEGNAEVWGLPTFSLNPGITYYSLDDKFSAWAEMTIQDGTYYRYDGETNKTDSRFDLSLGSEYFFTEKLGATLQVNNLFGNKYQRFYSYPTIGTQIQIGLVARF
jgi:outer membrane receptor for ferric coprogen and ferric-rhodotorulic acid